MKVKFLLTLFVFLLTFSGAGAELGSHQYLVKIDLEKVSEVERLSDLNIGVLENLGTYCIARIDQDKMSLLEKKGFSFQILDENPEEKTYYLVYLNPQCNPQILKDYGKVWTLEERIALLRTSEKKANELPQFKFELKRLRKEPIRLREKEYRPPQALLTNPLIEEMVSKVSQTDIKKYIGDLSGENEVLIGGEPYTIMTRYSSTEGCFKASQYLYERFAEMGLQVEYHDYPGSYAPNVIATLPGLLTPKKIYIICGHFDCTSETPYSYAPGADDNASGTSSVLEAASIFAQYDFEATVRFCAFSGEEQGLVGSGYYASDCAAAGDSILGVLNFDMIGYVNSYPEDLDIISNSSSEWLADFVVAAADSYTTLNAVKHVSGIGYSDHASFWEEGYDAICGIEDEWPTNPNYHTTGDTLGTLTLSFATDVVRVGVAALAELANPFMPSGPYVVYENHIIDDDNQGGSSGDGDGEVDAGETIEMPVTLENIGSQTAYGVRAGLRTTDPYVTITDSIEFYGDIPSSSTKSSLEDYDFSISYDCPHGHQILFTLIIRDQNNNTWTDEFTITVEAPWLVYQSHLIDDDPPGGNGDGIADPGEEVTMPVTLKNMGGEDANGVIAILSSTDPYVTITSDSSAYPDIPASGTGTTLTPYVFDVDPSCPVGHKVPFILNIRANNGTYANIDTFMVGVGTPPILFVDDDGGDPYEGYFKAALDSTGIAYDVWTVPSLADGPSYSDMAGYKLVVWTTGEDYGYPGYPVTLTAIDQANLKTYLDGGGKLFLSSQDVLYDNDPPTSFIQNYLHVANHNDDMEVTSVAGVTGDPITDGMNFNLVYPPDFNNWSDYIYPDGSSAGIFIVTGREKIVDYCALRYPLVGPSTYQVVFFAFPFEAVPTYSSRAELMQRIVDWFQIGRPDVSITLDPDQTSVPRGGILGLTITLVNNTSQNQTVQGWTEVTMPNGNPYPGNPVLGPRTVTLTPNQTLSRHVNHPVPLNAPLGNYTYCGKVGTYPEPAMDEDCFIFTVTTEELSANRGESRH